MFPDVMVDIETTGNKQFDRKAIIQIAAVKFNYETGEVSDDMFDRCLRVHPGREWDFDTQQWWRKQGNVLQTIEARMEDPALVMYDFQQWLLKEWPRDARNGEGLQFWSKPTHFDFAFLASYFDMFGLDMPCHFRFARDMNSFMAGLLGTPGHPIFPDEPEMEGPAHNALFDTLFQVKLLLAAKAQTTQGVILA